MQTKPALVCASLLLPAIGMVALLRTGNRIPPSAPKFQQESPEFRATLDKARPLFDSGRFVEAAKIYDAGYRRALYNNDHRSAVRLLNNAASCWFALFRYRQAIDAYLKARQLAEADGDWEAAGTLSLNLSSLYLQMGEINSAAQAAERSAEELRRAPGHRRRAQLLLQMAKVKARQGDITDADPYFRAAVAEADRQENTPLMAQAWNLLGYELLEAERIFEAEGPLAEAFRLRKLGKNPDIDHSYRTLGMLRLAQGDLRSASALLDQAVAMAAARPGKVTGWSAYYLRGLVRMAEGDAAAALEDFRAGIELARRLRLEVLPADAMRLGMEIELQRLYSALIRAAAQTYRATGRQELLREAFEAAEENRAASLRAMVSGSDGWLSLLPPEYGELVRRLRSAQTRAATRPDPEAEAEMARLRHALTEMELKAGLDFGCGSGVEGGRGLLEAVRRRLRPGQALLSFHLDEPESYLWAVTRGGLRLRVLPGRGRIAGLVAEFARAVRNNSQEADGLGARIYDAFFAGDPIIERSEEWVLSLDDTLFRMPFAALAAGSEGGRPVRLIERHSLRVTPSAHLLAVAPAGEAPGPARFIGVGDPVYNSADPRARSRIKQAAFELPRLAGSAREVESCARVWMPGRPAVLLSGTQASRRALAEALPGPGPAILHFATHVVPSQGQGLLALTLREDGRPELVSPAEIATWRANLRLVVLSGCSSGTGEALPGAGLMGMTRAWLAAGASSVAASHWPTPDDSGEFFLSFYRILRGNGGLRPSEALRRAQVEALRSGGFRSEPSRWAAYFLIGKE